MIKTRDPKLLSRPSAGPFEPEAYQIRILICVSVVKLVNPPDPWPKAFR